MRKHLYYFKVRMIPNAGSDPYHDQEFYILSDNDIEARELLSSNTGIDLQIPRGRIIEMRMLTYSLDSCVLTERGPFRTTLCFSCDRRPQKYVTGLCEECNESILPVTKRKRRR